MLVMVGNIRKGVITFISWVAMIDGQSMVEEIVHTEFTPLGSGIFLDWIGRA
jgi:hypothetical protein